MGLPSFYTDVAWPAHPRDSNAGKKEKRNWWICSWLIWFHFFCVCFFFPFLQSKNQVHRRGEYNVYSTFQSHEPEFDYLKSLEIEEKINKIRWLPQQNAAYFLLSTNGTWRWLCLFGNCRDTISKPCISISLELTFWAVEKLSNSICKMPTRVLSTGYPLST